MRSPIPSEKIQGSSPELHRLPLRAPHRETRKNGITRSQLSCYSRLIGRYFAHMTAPLKKGRSVNYGVRQSQARMRSRGFNYKQLCRCRKSSLFGHAMPLTMRGNCKVALQGHFRFGRTANTMRSKDYGKRTQWCSKAWKRRWPSGCPSLLQKVGTK